MTKFIKVTIKCQDGTEESSLIPLDTIETIRVSKTEGVYFTYKGTRNAKGVAFCDYIKESAKEIAALLSQADALVKLPPAETPTV